MGKGGFGLPIGNSGNGNGANNADEKTTMTKSLQLSNGVERARNGFWKNKSTEKNPESEENLLERRSDGTDPFDTLYIGRGKFSQHDFLGGIYGTCYKISDKSFL